MKIVKILLSIFLAISNVSCIKSADVDTEVAYKHDAFGLIDAPGKIQMSYELSREKKALENYLAVDQRVNTLHLSNADIEKRIIQVKQIFSDIKSAKTLEELAQISKRPEYKPIISIEQQILSKK